MKLVCVVGLMLAAAADVNAETAVEAPPARRLVIPASEVELRQSPAAGQSRDSLKNGAIIGAVAGAATLGTIGLVICELLKEPDDPSCWPGTLGVAAIGAGIGAAAGAGVDALVARTHSRQPGGAPGRRVAVAWQRRF